MKQEMISGPFQETTFTRITLNRIKRNVPREESFSIPLRYIDVTRATSTTLDVMLERRVDDPRLIRLMDWIHSNHILDENLQTGTHGPGSG